MAHSRISTRELAGLSAFFALSLESHDYHRVYVRHLGVVRCRYILKAEFPQSYVTLIGVVSAYLLFIGFLSAQMDIPSGGSKKF